MVIAPFTAGIQRLAVLRSTEGGNSLAVAIGLLASCAGVKRRSCKRRNTVNVQHSLVYAFQNRSE
jgi:hypothetical protein